MALTENFQQSSTALAVNGTVITILTALTAQSATKVLLMVNKSLTVDYSINSVNG